MELILDVQGCSSIRLCINIIYYYILILIKADQLSYYCFQSLYRQSNPLLPGTIPVTTFGASVTQEMRKISIETEI